MSAKVILNTEHNWDRRKFLWLGAASFAVLATQTLFVPKLFAATPAAPKDVQIENFDGAGKSLGKVTVPFVVKTDAEWKKQLPAESYTVTRHEGTERPFTGATWNNHADGLYRCICCDTALFDSRTKFESGTGWPSFYQPISATNVVKTTDRTLGMLREAISCKRCNAHLGHVFDDGPKPTGLRYCMNSAAMKFAARITQKI